MKIFISILSLEIIGGISTACLRNMLNEIANIHTYDVNSLYFRKL